MANHLQSVGRVCFHLSHLPEFPISVHGRHIFLLWYRLIFPLELSLGACTEICNNCVLNNTNKRNANAFCVVTRTYGTQSFIYVQFSSLTVQKTWHNAASFRMTHINIKGRKYWKEAQQNASEYLWVWRITNNVKFFCYLPPSQSRFPKVWTTDSSMFVVSVKNFVFGGPAIWIQHATTRATPSALGFLFHFLKSMQRAFKYFLEMHHLA